MNESGTSLLQERWKRIEALRPRIADALKEYGAEMPRRDRKLLRRLAGWFSGSRGLEAAVQRPDVLAVCLPLIQSDAVPSEADVGRLVRVGYGSIGRTIVYRGGLIRLLLFPVTILAAIAIFAVFFSAAIIPHFEGMFEGFGIPLPEITLVVFKFARLVRIVWPIVFACLAGLAVFGLAMNLSTNGRRDFAENWLEQRFKTTRNAVAGWAWHLAMLLESGFGAPHAIEIAGDSQSNRWLKSACQRWLREHSEPSASSPTLSPAFGGRFPLIRSTLDIDNRAAQVDLLREIATYYWTRNFSIGDWWIRWLNSMLLWTLLFAIVLVVFAVYSPMISILSALGGF